MSADPGLAVACALFGLTSALLAVAVVQAEKRCRIERLRVTHWRSLAQGWREAHDLMETAAEGWRENAELADEMAAKAWEFADQVAGLTTQEGDR